MKLFVEKVSNGSASIVSEWNDNVKGAMVSFHDACKALWNADDVQTATVKVVTESLDVYNNKVEYINKVEPQPEE